MSHPEIHYWEPRVMRHVDRDGSAEFGIHDAYFSEDGELLTYTEDSLSPRHASVDLLRDCLQRLLPAPGEEVECGDLGYAYGREDIEEWIGSTQKEVLEYTHTEEPPDLSEGPGLPAGSG